MIFVSIAAFLSMMSLVDAVSLQACQIYCSSENGGPSFNNCSPWNSYAKAQNKSCYNLCVHNCAAVYDGTCIDHPNFRCCMNSTYPTRGPEFVKTGCNLLYNNIDPPPPPPSTTPATTKKTTKKTTTKKTTTKKTTTKKTTKKATTKKATTKKATTKKSAKLLDNLENLLSDIVN